MGPPELGETQMNIRNAADRNTLQAQGYKFVTVQPRGEDKGRVVSRHKTRDAAEKAANGRELAIVDAQETMY